MSARNVRRAVSVIRFAGTLGWRQKTALLLIADRTSDEDLYWESRYSLGARMGCSAKTAGKAVKELEEAGHLKHIGNRTHSVDTSDLDVYGPDDWEGEVKTAWTKSYRLLPGVADPEDLRRQREAEIEEALRQTDDPSVDLTQDPDDGFGR